MSSSSVNFIKHYYLIWRNHKLIIMKTIFSIDMGQVDEILPAVMIDVIQIFLQLGGIIVVIAVVNYYFIIPTVIVGIIFYFLRGYYLSASRNIKRIEAISKLFISEIRNWFRINLITINISVFHYIHTISSFTNLFASECILKWANNDPFIRCATHFNQRIR